MPTNPVPAIIKHPGHFVPCKICRSPYQEQIDRLLRTRTRYETIADRYEKYFTCKRSTLIKTMSVHVSHDHPKKLKIFKRELLGVDTKKEASIKDYAKTLLRIGTKMAETFPLDVKHSDVVASQKLMMDEEQHTLQKDALRKSIAYIFGGVGQHGEMVEEGEIAENEPPARLKERNSATSQS